MFQLSKNGTLFGLFRFSLSFLFACAAINWDKSAFRTTIIEDTHLTLAVILFKVEANNFLSFFAITNTREKSCQVSVPLVYNSMVMHYLFCGVRLFLYYRIIHYLSDRVIFYLSYRIILYFIKLCAIYCIDLFTIYLIDIFISYRVIHYISES